MIEACKYVKTQAPYEGTHYHGHFTDAEVRELGVPLVTGDIPGFVVMIGPAPSTEEAVETIKGYQSRGIFVFLIGGIIEQAVEAGLSMSFPVRVVPVGEDIWSVGHVISLVVRAAMIFGAIQPGERLRQISGMAPSLSNRPAGCAFAPRCAQAQPQCTTSEPERTTVGARTYRCFAPLVALDPAA